jgi:hypothetical protein
MSQASVDAVPGHKKRVKAAPPVPVLSVEEFAQLGSVRICFGDLTVLVGPQATRGRVLSFSSSSRASMDGR